MTTNNTGNPVPSGSNLDFFDNAQSLDEFMCGPLDFYRNRLGAEFASLANILKATKPGYLKQQRSFADMDMLSNVGDTKQLDLALSSGTVRVCFVGDSITEGDRDGIYDNCAAAIIMRTLVAQNPDVNFVFANFSLAGRGIGTYSDLNYKGIAAPDNAFSGFYRPAGDELTRQWPGGSVIGKAWANHSRDFAPDLVVMLFGANDVFGDSKLIASMYKQTIAHQNTWAKIPSTALATAALPAVKHGYQNEVQIAADVTRGIARELKLTLLDINRLFHIHRYATDVENPFYVREEHFPGYPTGWEPEPGTTLGVQNGDTTLFGVGAAMRSIQTRDVNIQATFVMVDWAAQTGSIRYRSLGTGLTQYTAMIAAGTLFLYWGGTVIGSAAIPLIPNGTAATLRVDVRGELHRVFLNGVQLISVRDYGNVRKGKHGVNITGGNGAVYSWVAHLGGDYQAGVPELTDVDLYGIDDYFANPNTLGGNGINHPTKLANTVIWAASYFPLLQHIKRAPKVKKSTVLSKVLKESTDVFDVAGTFFLVEIDAVWGPFSGLYTSPTGALVSCQNSNLTEGGRVVNVRVRRSDGSLFLSADVTVPAGSWMISASATLTKDASGAYRNSMIVNGVRAA